jgi:hypothetical protein
MSRFDIIFDFVIVWRFIEGGNIFTGGKRAKNCCRLQFMILHNRNVVRHGNVLAFHDSFPFQNVVQQQFVVDDMKVNVLLSPH